MYRHADGSLEYQDSSPVCKRFPPTYDAGGSIREPRFTDVHQQQWCGEWTPAKPETFSEAATTIARLVVLGDRTGVHALVDMIQEERA